MAALHITRRLLRAVRSFYANRQRDALLRDCDPRMLKDIGLRWERGKLVPINPERFTPKSRAVAASSTAPGESESPGEVCPRCGARLA
ncbi:hypothetical protein ACUY1T_21110 [Billgrantia sp. Q4P2]|uniref:hypothetical protein n=1 Tax=Billgrantia sp. Q4P2 TaxID=3463857 RepID=UPI004055B146